MDNAVMYPIAKDGMGGWVKIKDAIRKQEYHCPECNTVMVPKLGDIKAHHFSHYPGYNGECTGESGWHIAAKYMLTFYLEQNKKLSYFTHCPNKFSTWCEKMECRINVHRESVESVIVEKSTDDIKPDLLIKVSGDRRIYGEIVYKNPVDFDKYEDRLKTNELLLIWVLDKINPSVDIPETNLRINTLPFSKDNLRLVHKNGYSANRV